MVQYAIQAIRNRMFYNPFFMFNAIDISFYVFLRLSILRVSSVLRFISSVHLSIQINLLFDTVLSSLYLSYITLFTIMTFVFILLLLITRPSSFFIHISSSSAIFINKTVSLIDVVLLFYFS